MDMFNLGPLPLGWECKIETKYGKLYFINHATKTTTWDDPRLAAIPTPPYHVAITQPTAYFEDTIGSRWSSPLPSLKGFSLHRRGSSPRLGGSPRIAPSPTLPPRNKRNEQVILESRAGAGGGSGGITQTAASGSVLHNQQQLFPYPHAAKVSNGTAATTSTASPAKYNNYAIQDKGVPETIPERPNSRSSGCSSYYITSASNASTHISTSHLVSCDTDTAYKTICAMFPTAPETHVRHLFHKYHNRPNLVVSALQVEKHPLSSDFSSNQIEVYTPSRKNSGVNLDDTLDHDNKSIGVSSPGRGTRSSYLTDSPARTGTPGSLMRFSNNQSSAGSLFTKSWGSPIPPSPQMQMGRETPGKLPTKSPNMKLKYMKGIFPAADETVLLDVLASCENNVQRASERLMRKGFARTPPPKPARQKWLEVKSMIEKRQKALDQQKIVNFQHEMRGEPQESPFPTPIMKTARPHVTAQQKMDSQKSLMNKFPNLPDRFIAWALEVAQFQQEKAERLLKEVCPQTPEEFKPFITTANKTTSMSTRTLSTESTSMYDEDSSEKSDESRAKRGDEDRLDKENVLPLMPKSISKTFADKELQTPDSGYFEPEQRPRKKGFLASLFSRKSDKSEKFFSLTSKKAKGASPSLAKGSNPALIQKTYVQALGPSKQRKGPDPNNRTGSQYQPKGPNSNLVHGPMWSAAVNKSRYSNKPQVTFDVVGGHDF